MDGPRVCHTDRSKSEREKQTLYANTYIWNLKTKTKPKKNGHKEPRGKTGIKTQTYQRMDLRIRGGGRVSLDGKLGQSERVAWTYIHYQM